LLLSYSPAMIVRRRRDARMARHEAEGPKNVVRVIVGREMATVVRALVVMAIAGLVTEDQVIEVRVMEIEARLLVGRGMVIEAQALEDHGTVIEVQRKVDRAMAIVALVLEEGVMVIEVPAASAALRIVGREHVGRKVDRHQDEGLVVALVGHVDLEGRCRDLGLRVGRWRGLLARLNQLARSTSELRG
jgi:hypothetical protein